MGRRRRWSDDDLRSAVRAADSVRGVLLALNLIPAGGNYQHVTARIRELGLATDHFTGQGWRRGKTFDFHPKKKLADILVKDSDFQSYKLKRRLFVAGLKEPKCEICGWAEHAEDGRIPVELDHINGDRRDNRIKNLRVLCPNCHSLQPTHRGKNHKKCRGGEIGRRATLKML